MQSRCYTILLAALLSAPLQLGALLSLSAHYTFSLLHLLASLSLKLSLVI